MLRYARQLRIRPSLQTHNVTNTQLLRQNDVLHRKGTIRYLKCRVQLGLVLTYRGLPPGRPWPYKPLELVIKVIKLIKCGKIADTSLIVAEILKVSWVKGAQQIRDLIEDIIHFGNIPTAREGSIIVSLYKGKGVALQ